MSGPRYIIAPGDVLDDPRVTDLHLRVIAEFGRQTDRNGWLQANQRRLAEKLGRSRETINRVIADLVGWGYVRKQQRYSGKDGRQLINDYQVVMDRDDRSGEPAAQPESENQIPPCDPHVTGGCDVQITGGVTSGDHTPCDPQTSHHKNDPLLQRPLFTSPEVNRARGGEFERFWADYPHKVGKRDAKKAFERARKRADFDTIMAGLRRYAAKRDDRPWCNPATFLNQDRWGDQPAAVSPRGRGPPQRERFADYLNARFPEQDDGIDQHTGPTIDASFAEADLGDAEIPLLEPRRAIWR